MFRRLLNVRNIVILVICTIIMSLHSFVTFRMSEKEVNKFFNDKKVKGSQHTYEVGFRKMHYIQSGATSKPLVVFLHGSPGSSSAFIDFMADTMLLNKALLITADRPGFGYSNLGLAEPSLQKQTALLKPILEKYKDNRPVILVGHSLGGPLIARMAMDYPELVDGLVIVAGSIDPDLEPNETWFRAPLATPFLSWILPRAFRASNDEIYKLQPELQQMIPLWSTITCKVIVIQGTKDSLVSPRNVEFAKKMLVNAQVEFVVRDINHFVPWSNPELIREAIVKLLMPK